MAKAEAARPDRIDAVAIVTPNHLQAPVATAFLRAGIPVICDKPPATTVEDADALVRLVSETGLAFILTQTHTDYPMTRETRALVVAGRIGRVRHVQVEYLQDWLAERSVIADNILDRDFEADRPKQKWLADLTYIWTTEGWLYVAVVLDLFSRRAVGCSVKSDRDVSLVMDAQ